VDRVAKQARKGHDGVGGKRAEKRCPHQRERSRCKKCGARNNLAGGWGPQNAHAHALLELAPPALVLTDACAHALLVLAALALVPAGCSYKSTGLMRNPKHKDECTVSIDDQER
jgi:hypothetical protein